MNRKFYWGLGVLMVLLIGVTAVLLMRTTETETQTVYKDIDPSQGSPPPAEPGYKWVWHHDHWDKVRISNVEQNAEQVVEHGDVPIVSEVSDISSHISSQLAEGAFDFAVKIPTDVELPQYSARDLSILLHEALQESHDMGKKYVALTTLVMEERHRKHQDKVQSGTYWAWAKELRKLDREIYQVYHSKRSELREEIDRIRQYRDALEALE